MAEVRSDARLNVNPVSGTDTNHASATQPLNTLAAALKLAEARDAVRLAGGEGVGAPLRRSTPGSTSTSGRARLNGTPARG